MQPLARYLGTKIMLMDHPHRFLSAPNNTPYVVRSVWWSRLERPTPHFVEGMPYELRTKCENYLATLRLKSCEINDRPSSRGHGDTAEHHPVRGSLGLVVTSRATHPAFRRGSSVRTHVRITKIYLETLRLELNETNDRRSFRDHPDTEMPPFGRF